MSSSVVFQIEIPKRGSSCVLCQEHFGPGVEFHSTLKDSPDQGIYLRQDYCLSCWKKATPQLDLELFRSTWKSKVPIKKETSDLPKQRDARAMYLLKEALKGDRVDDYAETFILAMYLARKRLIYFRQDLLLEDGQKAALYEVAQSEEMLCVRKVAPSTLHIEKIQIALAAKFK
ncbi:MAG: hypothetical protein H0X29_11630 [Parachlamydiaceae bacterium]|nr:hypothetical protein [Parachlamydiaceae bacterium]